MRRWKVTIKQLLDTMTEGEDSEEFWTEYLENQLGEFERPADCREIE